MAGDRERANLGIWCPRYPTVVEARADGIVVLGKVDPDVCMLHYVKNDKICKTIGCAYYAKLKGYEPIRKKEVEFFDN